MTMLFIGMIVGCIVGLLIGGFGVAWYANGKEIKRLEREIKEVKLDAYGR